MRFEFDDRGSFDQRELHVISSALRIAAEQFGKDATATEKELPRLRDQFLRQQKEATAIADEIDSM